MGASASAAAQDADEEARRQLNAYTYLSAPERLEHVAIMRVFCGTLLADLAVPGITAKLRQAGGSAAGLDADTLTVRLEQLVRWGNLLRSSHTVNASSRPVRTRPIAAHHLSASLGELSLGWAGSRPSRIFMPVWVFFRCTTRLWGVLSLWTKCGSTEARRDPAYAHFLLWLVVQELPEWDHAAWERSTRWCSTQPSALAQFSSTGLTTSVLGLVPVS
ncbi:DUF2397 family protein [Streptomyces sp. NBC_00343]|uniref:DUF2397 family protein n=1 Tax=Streptomyces sp. NBC_00343 TaxID=2975719 RepID=UPI002E2BFD5A|nr:DUF2397 family protein [Streptomyces sp. NBC_00343]